MGIKEINNDVEHEYYDLLGYAIDGLYINLIRTIELDGVDSPQYEQISQKYKKYSKEYNAYLAKKQKTKKTKKG